MRLLSVAMLAALLIGGGVAGFETAVGATVTPTAKVVVRPVTSTGHVRAGFTMVSEPTGLVDCNAQDPSPGAVSRNIEFCSPSAEYAIACWKAAAPHRVLCMRDPRSTRVVRIPRTGTFAPTGLAPLSQRAPLAITLADKDLIWGKYVHCSAARCMGSIKRTDKIKGAQAEARA